MVFLKFKGFWSCELCQKFSKLPIEYCGCLMVIMGIYHQRLGFINDLGFVEKRVYLQVFSWRRLGYSIKLGGTIFSDKLGFKQNQIGLNQQRLGVTIEFGDIIGCLRLREASPSSRTFDYFKLVKGSGAAKSGMCCV